MSIASLCETIQKHLITLKEKLCFYFSSTAINCCDWVRDFYSSVAELHNTLTLQEQEELIELRKDGGLRLQFFDLSSDRFWIMNFLF